MDYRKLNDVTKKDVYPLPRIDDILDTLSGAKFFSTPDLAAGYWQIGLDPATSAKSAFVTHQGLHDYSCPELRTFFSWHHMDYLSCGCAGRVWVLAGFIAAAQPTMSAFGMQVLARVLVSD